MIAAKGGVDPQTWSRTADYILDTAAQTSLYEKVESFRVTNCGTDDPGHATQIIEAIQAANTRSKIDKTYHLVFSFPPGEKPSLDVLHAIEDELVAAIGLSDHQRISAVHQDTDHYHVHVAINQVHPTGLQNIVPFQDMPKLMEACERLEKQYGLTPTNHGLENGKKRDRSARIKLGPEPEYDTLFRAFLRESYDLSIAERPEAKTYNDLRVLSGSDVARSPQSYQMLLQGHASDSLVDGGAEHASSVRRTGNGYAGDASETSTGTDRVKPPATIKLGAIEIHGGIESLASYVAREVAPAMRAATTWAELHQAMAEHGLQIKPRAAGLVIGDAGLGLWCKASSAGRDLSAKSLSDRLGPFERPIASPNPGDSHKGGHSEQRRAQGADDGNAVPDDRKADEATAAPLFRVEELPLPGSKDQEPKLVLETSDPQAAIAAANGRPNAIVKDDRTGKTVAQTVWENDGSTPVLKLDPVFAARAGRGRSVQGQPATDRTAASAKGYAQRPRQAHPSSQALYARYQQERTAAQNGRKSRYDAVRKGSAVQKAELQRWSAAQRLIIKGTMRGPAKKVAFAALHAQVKARRAAIAKQAMQQRAHLARQSELPSWNAWLCAQAEGGNTDALAVLRSRAAREEKMRGDLLTAERADRAKTIIMDSLKATARKDGSMAYRTADGGIVIDRQTHVQSQSSTAGAALVALTIAAERFGNVPLDVRGTDQFRREVAQLAGMHGTRVTFADPQMEALRNQLVTKSVARPVPQVPPSTGVQASASASKAEPNPAVLRWIEKRNSLGDKIYSIDYNRLWTPKDAGVATYQGRRKMDDGSEVLLLKRGSEMLVKPSTSNVVAKASRWTIGQTVTLDERGRFVTKSKGIEI